MLAVILLVVLCGLGGDSAAGRDDALFTTPVSFSEDLARSGRVSIGFGGRTLLEPFGLEAPPGFRVDISPQGDALILQGRLPESGKGPGVSLRIQHHIVDARHVWVPHLSPEPGFVIGDHAFRSPAIVVADDKRALVLIPDLDDVAAGYRAGWRTWLDYDHPARTATIAAGNYRTEGHVFYKSADLDYKGQEVKLTLHYRASNRAEDLANPYGMAARFMWERWGRPRHRLGGSQRAPLGKYMAYICRWAFEPEGWGDTVWQEFTIDGRECGAPAFIVDVAQHPSVPVEKRRWREQRSVWNQAWFSTQRTANGLYRYARRIGSEELARRARFSTDFALAAPQNDGLFPSAYTTAPPGQRKWYQLYSDTPGWEQGRWTNSDRHPVGVSDNACHIVDAAFTARLLLEWSDLTGGDTEAVDYALRFADRLCRLQRPSGAFPAWVEQDGKVQPPLADSPETAMGATLLLELAERFGPKEAWCQTARQALQFLETDPVANGRWEDFETYYSCCPWGVFDQMGKRVARNGVYKQNTLSPFWCAEAFLAAHRVFKDDRYLAVGRRCLDELALFQQVWDPPFIAAPCHGGWGVMNADGEWNDARQSLFAPLYIEYYKVTGEPEYFERGVAALRASFVMLYCPENDQVRKQYELKHPMFGPESYGFMMENIAHGGPAPPDGSAIGPFTIYTWGNGAALASAAKVLDLCGDVHVDTARGLAFGVDGCSARVEGDTVRIEDRYQRTSLAVVYADGSRREVPISNGAGLAPLKP